MSSLPASEGVSTAPRVPHPHWFDTTEAVMTSPQQVLQQVLLGARGAPVIPHSVQHRGDIGWAAAGDAVDSETAIDTVAAVPVTTSPVAPSKTPTQRRIRPRTVTRFDLRERAVPDAPVFSNRGTIWTSSSRAPGDPVPPTTPSGSRTSTTTENHTITTNSNHLGDVRSDMICPEPCENSVAEGRDDCSASTRHGPEPEPAGLLLHFAVSPS